MCGKKVFLTQSSAIEEFMMNSTSVCANASIFRADLCSNLLKARFIFEGRNGRNISLFSLAVGPFHKSRKSRCLQDGSVDAAKSKSEEAHARSAACRRGRERAESGRIFRCFANRANDRDWRTCAMNDDERINETNGERILGCRFISNIHVVATVEPRSG